MSDPVTYETKDNIALILINSPPVNGLGQSVRAGLLECYRRAVSDDAVAAIVIGSATGVFCGGADISEFLTGKSSAEPILPHLLDEIEESAKPVVAAIDGVALGGGLELALVCDYRIATPTAKLGLPEVALGLIPGAGGTQRLPRIIGPAAALELIVAGKPITGSEALSCGLIDNLTDSPEGKPGSVIISAIAYAKELVATGAPVRSCANIAANTRELAPDFFSTFRQNIARKTRGFFAPEQCIQAVEAACTLPLAEGLKKEQVLFAACMATPQARAQQHIFFAERAAAKIPGVDPKTPPRKIEKVAVIGSGTMGGGIAMNFINAGFPTTLLDLNEEALNRGLGAIRNNYEISAKKGRLTQQQLEQRMALINASTDYADIADADLVIEAVFEKMEIKQTVFKTLDEVCKPGAILATNTSTLDVDQIAAVTQRPQDVIGLHFFSPANVMRLLEVVRAKQTADDVIVTTLKLAKRINKLPVVVGVCFGFVGNRMLEPYGREAFRLLLEGATPNQIDTVLTDFGFAMGVCSMIDLAGNDISYMTRQSRRATFADDPSYAIVGDRLYEQGDYGQKTGRGFYCYSGRDKSDNPQVLEITAAAARELGITQRRVSNQEILERCLYPLINEGAKILDEGIAYRASDCDLVYVNGYGFPAWRGGPMHYADEIGLDIVLAAINKYRTELGDYGDRWFTPSPLLVRLANAGKTFSSLDK